MVGCVTFKEIENGAAEITWQITLLLLLCFIAFKKNVKIMYLFMYLQGRENVRSAVCTKTV